MILSAAGNDTGANSGDIVVEFVLVDRFIQLIYTGSDNSDTFYQRIAYVFRIANNFRAIYDMYQQYETESSPLYSDRLAAYVAMVCYAGFNLPPVDHR